MVCGRDYHGGNAQDGCGHSFNWNDALPYNQDEGAHLPAGDAAEVPVRPEAAAEVTHEIAAGIPMQCSLCEQPIVGPRFSCVNCPPDTFDVCVQCEGSLSCEVGSAHDHRHTFQVITE